MDEKEYNPELCDSCQHNPAEDDHTCPYHQDVMSDHEFECNCCKVCEHNCCMEI